MLMCILYKNLWTSNYMKQYNADNKYSYNTIFQGDSGGPLLVNSGGDDKYELVGNDIFYKLYTYYNK